MAEDTAPAPTTARSVPGASEAPALTVTVAPAPARRTSRLARAGLRPWGVTALAGLAAILLFIFALRLLVVSAGALAAVLDALDAGGVLNLIGLGWLGSYLVFSGSPVAASAMTLLDAGVLTPMEAFGQVVGSRIGASFVVLAVGFLYYLRGRRLADSVHVGVVAFLVTVTTWIPVALLGMGALEWGWFDGVELGSLAPLRTLTENGYNPIIDLVHAALPDALLFLLGLALLLGALRLFDAALPTPEATSDRLARLPARLRSRWTMFALGALVTLATFSVAVSLTLLVPLALRGSIRRDAVIPYVLGANITTYIDTLFASAALENGATGTVVLVTMIFATAVAGIVLVLLYHPYVLAVNRAAHWISRDRRCLGLFVAGIVAAPAALLVL